MQESTRQIAQRIIAGDIWTNNTYELYQIVWVTKKGVKVRFLSDDRTTVTTMEAIRSGNVK